ncbi:MAG: hypothetical protein R3E14_07675 [Erythrobacter sp.]
MNFEWELGNFQVLSRPAGWTYYETFDRESVGASYMASFEGHRTPRIEDFECGAILQITHPKTLRKRPIDDGDRNSFDVRPDTCVAVLDETPFFYLEQTPMRSGGFLAVTQVPCPDPEG